MTLPSESPPSNPASEVQALIDKAAALLAEHRELESKSTEKLQEAREAFAAAQAKARELGIDPEPRLPLGDD